MAYEKFLKTVDWRKPLDRGRTPSENRAAIAKVDQLVEETGCTKTQAFCKVQLHFNTYYKVKRADGLSPTPHSLEGQIRAANNGGGPGKPKGHKSNTPIGKIQYSLSLLEREVRNLKSCGLDLQLTIGGVSVV